MLKTVTAAIEILNLLAEDTKGLTLSEIALRAGINKQAAFRLAKTLTRAGFVATDPRSRRLTLGSALLRLAARVHPQPGLREIALPVLTRLRDRTGETACLHIRHGDQRACMMQVESRDELRCVATIGELLPLTGAAGRVFLACMEKQERVRLLDKGWSGLTPDTVTDRNRLNRLIRDVQRNGFALARNETVTGTSAVSAPVRGPDGRAEAAVTLLGPTSRLTRRHLLGYAPAVCEAAAEITVILGGAAAASHPTTLMHPTTGEAAVERLPVRRDTRDSP
jgi:DNA-binding IclR family transcriptional regulator